MDGICSSVLKTEEGRRDSYRVLQISAGSGCWCDG